MNIHSIIEEQAAEKAGIPLDEFKRIRKEKLKHHEDWSLVRGTIRLSKEAVEKVLVEFPTKNGHTKSSCNSSLPGMPNLPAKNARAITASPPAKDPAGSKAVPEKIEEDVTAAKNAPLLKEEVEGMRRGLYSAFVGEKSAESVATVAKSDEGISEACDIPEKELAAVLGLPQAKLKAIRKSMNPASFAKVGKRICFSRAAVEIIIQQLELPCVFLDVIHKVLNPETVVEKQRVNLIFDKAYQNPKIVAAIHPGTREKCRLRVREGHNFVHGGLMPAEHEQVDLWRYVGKYPHSKSGHSQISRRIKNLAESEGKKEVEK